MAHDKYPHVQDFFWRRALAGTALALAAALAWGAADRFVSSAVPTRAAIWSCPAGGHCVPGKPPGYATYVARPGDTLWAIAVRYSHGQDPRPLEYELETQIGGGALQPGEVLHVP